MHRLDPRQAGRFFAYVVDLPLRDQVDPMTLSVFALGKLHFAKKRLGRLRGVEAGPEGD